MTSPWWQSRSWRMIQTNLREIDMADICAGQVVTDLQDFKANVLMINAAGIIASYPTKLPYHFQSPYLTGDSLQDILAACHAADIQVIARTDFSKVRRPIYEQYPQWASVTATGEIIDYNGDVQVCINGGYQQDAMLSILEELFSTHNFDGIFFNMGGYQTRDYSGLYYGICHCENCQRSFDEMFGLPLPFAEDRADPVFRKYEQFKARTLKAHRARVVSFIHERWPDVCIAEPQGLGEGFQRMESNTAIERPLPHWQYSGSDNPKWITSTFPGLVSSNTTVDFIDFPYRHVAVSPHQQALRLAQSLANGGALDYYLIGRLDNHEDRSGFEAVKGIFRFHAANQDCYGDLTSMAEIALLKEGNGWHASDEYRGWFRFLVENHYLFDSPGLEQFADLDWSRYRAIILPDVASIDDGLAVRLDQFAADGGILIAVGESGFYDQEGVRQAVPALQSLGMRSVQQIRTDMRSSYFKLDSKTGFDRFEQTDLLYMDGPYIYGDYERDVQTRFQLIPPHKFGPPERCYYTQVTDHPAFTMRFYGRGKAIFIPWLPGTLFHRQGYPNTSDFVADLLGSVAGLKPVGGNLSPMVEVTCFEKADHGRELVHLVNASGHFGVSFFEPVTIHEVVVGLPCERFPAQVNALVGGDCSFDWADGSLVIRIPKLGLFEALENLPMSKSKRRSDRLFKNLQALQAPVHDDAPDRTHCGEIDTRGMTAVKGQDVQDVPDSTHLPRMKKFRFQLLHQWLIHNFDPCRAADIGGGKGLLAHLLIESGWQATVIDPIPQELPDKYKDIVLGRRVKIDPTASVPNLPEEFAPHHARAFDLLIAMHAHGCNALIIDAAAQYGCGFVLFPCCVIDEPFYPPLGVHWLESLADYALLKDHTVKPFRLNFKGQNIGLYAPPKD